jgi:hypothetical protein
MLLLGAFFALLTVGFWRRRARRPRRLVRPAGPAAEAAFRRRPAGRALLTDAELADVGLATARQPNASPVWATPCGPDDDPEFLRELDRLIRGRRPRGHDA